MWLDCAENRGSFTSSLTAEELERANARSTIIFTNSVDSAMEVESFLRRVAPALKIVGLHKKLSPAEREAKMAEFFKGGSRVLVCTDVAARGLDTVDVEHVIQYEVATDATSYLHRIGRTGR